MLDVVVQPFSSVTVTEYIPDVNPLMLEVVAPLLHKYVYPEVPPDAVTLAVPLLPPKQLTLVVLPLADNALAGWLTTKPVAVPVHPL